MKMVVTLKNGVQVKSDVKEFTTGTAQIFGDLRSLKWTATEWPQTQINWIDISEIAAVHAEYDRDGVDAPVEVVQPPFPE